MTTPTPTGTTGSEHPAPAPAPAEAKTPSANADGTPAPVPPASDSSAVAPSETASTTSEYSEYNSQSDYGEYNYDYHSEHPEGSGTSDSGSSTTAVANPASESGNTGQGGGDSTEPPSTSDDSGDEGGPIKSFLEHLEDLRWVLVKCAIALLLGMMVCLFGVNYVVEILTWPLHRAGKMTSALISASNTKHVGVAVNDQILWQFKTETNLFAGLNLGSNQAVVMRMTTVMINDQPMLALKVETNSPLESKVSIGPKLVYLDPAAPFVSSLHIAFFGGLLLAAPFLFYFLGQYIVPALRWKEKKYFVRAFFIGLALFLTGVSFCYFAIMPLALRAAEQYALWMGIEVPQWRAETYFSFTCKFMLGMGLGFEMPVILLALVKIGILDYQKLAGFRRYMIVVNLILGALLTTPEVLTQLLMFIPLQLMYEMSIWVAWYWERQARKKAEAEAANPKQD
ncbi:MAG: twin-arginine translocase subunit TatC [Verrucomicrobiota bacterium]